MPTSYACVTEPPNLEETLIYYALQYFVISVALAELIINYRK